MKTTRETHTVSPEMNTRIRTNAERAVAQWTARLEKALENGSADQIDAIEETLAFWTRTAARDHTGRRIGQA